MKIPRLHHQAPEQVRVVQHPADHQMGHASLALDLGGDTEQAGAE